MAVQLLYEDVVLVPVPCSVKICMYVYIYVYELLSSCTRMSSLSPCTAVHVGFSTNVCVYVSAGTHTHVYKAVKLQHM